MFAREKYLILPILIPTPQWSRHFNVGAFFVVKVGCLLWSWAELPPAMMGPSISE